MPKCSFCNSRKGKRKCLHKGMAEVCSACCGENRTKEGCGGCSYYKTQWENKTVNPFDIKDNAFIYNEMIGFEKAEHLSKVTKVPTCGKEGRNYVDVPFFTVEELEKFPELAAVNLHIMLKFIAFGRMENVRIEDFLVVKVLGFLLDEYYYKDVNIQNEEDIIRKCYLFVSSEIKETFGGGHDSVSKQAFLKKFLLREINATRKTNCELLQTIPKAFLDMNIVIRLLALTYRRVRLSIDNSEEYLSALMEKDKTSED